MATENVKIQVDDTCVVSGLVQVPDQAFACYVMAHGAGAGMTHKFMAAVADGLEARGVATLRFQFPYMETGSKRPDRPAVAHAAVRGAVRVASQLMPGLALFAGGKSFGARMSSQAQSEAPMPSVRGLVFFGFPLHPANKPSNERARHLSHVQLPMLFLQGTRDALAGVQLLMPMVEALGLGACLRLIEHADHSFHVPLRSGKTDEQVLGEILDIAVLWMQAIVDHPQPRDT